MRHLRAVGGGRAHATREARAEWQKVEAERAQHTERYAAMLSRVADWQPPTVDHVGLKKFMHEQLVESQRFDCGYERPRPERVAALTWLAGEIAEWRRRLARYESEHADEARRANERTEWVKALRASLGGTS